MLPVDEMLPVDLRDAREGFSAEVLTTMPPDEGDTTTMPPDKWDGTTMSPDEGDGMATMITSGFKGKRANKKFGTASLKG